MFFSERYLGTGRKPPYLPLPSFSLMTLKRIAAHTVLMAENFNRDYIGGLDLFWCDKRKLLITQISPRGNKSLQAESRKMDGQIGDWIKKRP
jgi:hypothetical protein